MTLTTNRKRQLICALILISLLLILFAPCMKVNRAAAEMIGLGSDLLADIEYLEEMVGSTRLVRDMRGIFQSISDGKLSGGDILLDSFRLAHMIRAYQSSEFGGDAEMESVSLLLVLVILFFLALLGCGAAACVCCWMEKKQKKVLSLIYTGLLLLLIVALLIIEPSTYGIAKVAAAPFFALIAAGAAAYIIVFRSGSVPSVPRLPRIGRNPASAIRLPSMNRFPGTGKTLCLVCRGGFQDGKMYRIGNQTVIGRNPGCDIQYPMNYPGISRYHAILRMVNGTLMLCDLSSTGTALKRFGSVLPKGTAVPVGVGDVFYLGAQKNRFEIVAR